MVKCSLLVGSSLLPKAKELKYLWVLFMIDGKIELEMEWRDGAASVLGHWEEKGAVLLLLVKHDYHL